ncbi:MAG: FadR/GntR family transcriptional regulator [Bacillota bacterium]
MNLTSPINNDSVVNTVLNRIKEALINGELKPGEKLPSEQKFSEKMNIGRSTVREAIKMLEALGVVDIRRGDGTYIVESLDARSINPLIFSLILQTGDPKGLVELRYMVETGFVKLAIQKITNKDLEKIENVLNEHKAAVKKGEKENLGKLELKFHYTILETVRNPFVIELGRTILELFKSSISKVTKTVPERAVQDHERIFAAIKKRDPELADKAVKKSFEVWKKHLTYL